MTSDIDHQAREVTRVCDTRPASTVEAIAAVTAGLAYLARANAVALGTAAQADCLRALERAEAMHTAARARLLAAFHASGGCEPDGSGSTRAWLVWQTRVTRSAAAGAVGWMRRLRAHPALREALAAGTVSASWARQICTWTDRLPEASRPSADAILLGAAAGGASLYDLGALAEEMHLRARLQNEEERDSFEDRAVHFAQTFGCAGRLEGDLTPAASAALKAVLESLGGKAGPEDARSRRQRWHDALGEACVRLIGSGMLPQRSGQPVHLQLQITLDQLRRLASEGASTAETAWAARATSSGLSQAEVEGLACDATVFPVVTGRLDNTALDTLVQLFLNAFTHAPTSPPAGPGATASSGDGAPGSGAGLPPGRPPDACQVHHLIHREHGGPTSLANCYLVCRFHHLIAIHRWGWKLTAHPDGTMTATSPGGRALHSHPPPSQAALPTPAAAPRAHPAVTFVITQLATSTSPGRTDEKPKLVVSLLAGRFPSARASKGRGGWAERDNEQRRSWDERDVRPGRRPGVSGVDPMA